MQKGPLWWAGHHVTHHKYADRDGDPHSPHVSGFYYAHIGWFTNDIRYNKIEPTNPVVRDFGEVPGAARAERALLVRRRWRWRSAMYRYRRHAVAGLGLLLPTMTLAHATFCINTVNHLFGSRRFQTMDESRNNLLTAIFAAGEGWHNNHHRYQRAARNGFYWWEFDPTYYVIAVMGWLGLAWDIQAGARADLPRGRSADHRAARGADLDPSAEASQRIVRLSTRVPRSSSRASSPDQARPSCFSSLRSRNSICAFRRAQIVVGPALDARRAPPDRCEAGRPCARSSRAPATDRSCRC